MEIKDNYLYFETNKTIQNKKKITGHSFVALCDLDQFNKKGDMVLNLLGLYKKPFDVKYMYRGEVAEDLVRQYYEKKLHRPFIWYDEDAKKKNNYDFFKEYQQCGGIPDMEMQDDEEIIEIKSKSMNKMNAIANENNIPKEELYQALYYGYLRLKRKNIHKVTMAYVFFDKETENLIFNNQKPITYKYIKLFIKSYDMADYIDEIESLIKKALIYYNTCIEQKRIPLADISEEVLKSLFINQEQKDNGF